MRLTKTGSALIQMAAAIFILLGTFAGCTAPDRPQPMSSSESNVLEQEKVYTFFDPGGMLRITAPKGWVEDTRIMPFDMALLEEQYAYYTGVMIYYKRESGGEKAVLENMQFHIKDIASKRGNAQVIFSPTQEQMDTRTFTRAAISGEYEKKNYAYLFTAIDFGKAEDAFAILIQTCNLDDWEDARPILEEIGNSCMTLEEKTDAQ